MSYAGNPSLAPDVQARIVDTFRHTLDVAGRGDLEEARLGCDFILRLDPLFSPAQLLSDRLRAAIGPVPVGDLLSRLDGNGAGPADELSLEALPELPFEDDFGAATRPGVVGDGGQLRAELADLLARRNFEALMARAQASHVAIAADPELQRLMGEAQERMEAAPYVDRFLDKARAALAAGRADEARAAVDKARALDETHPAVQALVAQLSAPAAAPRPAAAPPPLAAAPAPQAFAAPRPSPMGPPSASDTSFADLDSESPLAFDPAASSFDSPSAFEPAGFEPAADLGNELPLDLPPLDLPDLDSGSAGELSFDELAADLPSATPAATAASDADPRIAELLDEGQALYGRGEMQGAIDAWSRIFLIDIDHQEAARRIDMARNAKAEQERRVEESYHDALARVQAGDLDAARTALQGVLALHPNHTGAREVLDKLDRGQLDDLPRPPAAGGADPFAALGEGADEELKEEILVPPEPGSAPARAAAAPARVEAPASRRKLLLGAAAVLVALLAAGWLLRDRWAGLFPNSEEPVVAEQRPEQTPITRATELAREGKRAMAIAQLKRVPPPSPYYEEAQALITQWEAEEAASQNPGGPGADAVERHRQLLALARQAAAERRFLRVTPLLDEAAAIAPLPAEDEALREEAATQLAPLREAITLLRSEEYERSLRQLWVVVEADSGNRDARDLLTGAYYNLAVLSLQQGKPNEALTHLREAGGLGGDDTEVKRLAQFAQTYDEREPDLLYRIYTKYLTPRKL
jgi:tetratricopeptide (TPR) repeat protein